ncbi:hypothetical protein IOD16_31060 [Saccharothrix sp. 6-C]|uniref:hypothetical protein n=1 Tax=Saccharothrix sp. 6-C TaxID=2781735 RepID=UPI001916E917|nr:hypothetical protein [Saccharothrix sp. 6-C]QQQ75492.1 hypothetical protein IOD16_31060 [Saccharothrix sp. 6-C]
MSVIWFSPSFVGRGRLCSAGTWVCGLQVAEGTDELKAYSGPVSRLWVVLKEKYGLEVMGEGKLVPPYQAAAPPAVRRPSGSRAGGLRHW